MIDHATFKDLARREDWEALYAMLDHERDSAVTADDMRSEVHWRTTALEWQKRYQEALDLLRDKAHVFNSKCCLQQGLAEILLKLGRNQEALAELSRAPFETEMASFYGLAMDAKFLYFYLLAKQGDTSVRDRLSEIPDGYRHITADGDFLMKTDVGVMLDAS